MDSFHRGKTLFESPQLSLAVHPSFRRHGFARTMCNQLHDLARIRGARSVRVLILRENKDAIALCKSLGYRLSPATETHLHGSRDLDEIQNEQGAARWHEFQECSGRTKRPL